LNVTFNATNHFSNEFLQQLTTQLATTQRTYTKISNHPVKQEPATHMHTET